LFKVTHQSFEMGCCGSKSGRGKEYTGTFTMLDAPTLRPSSGEGYNVGSLFGGYLGLPLTRRPIGGAMA